jgi:hypothetical protein
LELVVLELLQGLHPVLHKTVRLLFLALLLPLVAVVAWAIMPQLMDEMVVVAVAERVV